MRSKLMVGVVASVMVFLVVTSPPVVSAARQVTGHDIADGSVTGRDLKDGSVKSKDLKDGSVRAQDLQPGLVTGRVDQLRSFAGSIADTGPGIYPFTFLGPTATVVVGTNQSVVASGTATLGVDSGTTTADVAICWIRAGVQAAEGPRPLGGPDAVSDGVLVGTGRTVVAATGADTVAGTISLGMCVRTGPTLDDNDAASGFVQVVDTPVLP